MLLCYLHFCLSLIHRMRYLLRFGSAGARWWMPLALVLAMCTAVLVELARAWGSAPSPEYGPLRTLNLFSSSLAAMALWVFVLFSLLCTDFSPSLPFELEHLPADTLSHLLIHFLFL
jgi:hypothetical protein